MGLTDKLIYSMFIYQKTVDRSTLRQGFQIPVEYHALLAAMPGGMLSQCETRNIKVRIDNVEYDAQLKNQGFDRNKYGDHADVFQKRLYGYCCQMTGERIGERYDAIVVEAHHIVPFTQSMNNDSSNLIIISPSYHRIIHAAKPEWDPVNLSFKYPNGVVDRVVLNKHLKP